MRSRRKYLGLIFIVLLSAPLISILQSEPKAASILPSPLNSASQARDLLNNLTCFEVLGSVYDFDGRVRNTIGVDPHPIVYYPY